MKHVLSGILAACISAAASLPAVAQKSRDTLRIPLKTPIDYLSDYYSRGSEQTFQANAVFDGLIVFDEDDLVYRPLLAKSWTRVNDATLDFELRTDVIWHDGQKFSADDVVHTINWLIDPKVKLQQKGFYTWMDRAEKMSDTKVRIFAKQPTPYDLIRFAYQTDIYPAHIHGKLENGADFGRKPSGTGMYRAVQVDSNKGISLVKNGNYIHESKAKPASNVGRVEMFPVPDTGTQIAQLLAGQADIVRDPEIDQADFLEKDSRFQQWVRNSISYSFLQMDANGRGGQPALADVRVRKAILHAIDRAVVNKIVVGDADIPQVPALCWKPLQAGCDYSVKLPEYNPGLAKKLLEEAGHSGGFDLEITYLAGGRYRQVGEIMAEHLRQIGIRARLRVANGYGVLRNLQRDNKVQLVIGGWPAGSTPDVSATLANYFDPGPYDMFGDTEIHKLANESDGVMDPVKRKEIGRQIFDKITERAYVIPVAPGPAVFVHSIDVKMPEKTRLHPYRVNLGDINWK